MQEPSAYQDAIAFKYPEAVVVVIAKDEGGRYNPITLGWSMVSSSTPPMLAVAINARAHSVSAIRHSRAFVLAFPAATQAEEALFFGTHSGRDTAKLAATGTPTQPAVAIDGLLLSEAVANFECVLEGEAPSGDHIIFIGRVVASHRNAHPGPGRLYSLGQGGLGSAQPGEVFARR